MSDYNNQNQNGQERKFGPLDDLKLRLTTEAQQGSRRKPALSVKLYQNNPRIVVKTGVDNDKNFGSITASMEMPEFYAVLDAVDYLADPVASGTGKKRIKIELKKFKFIRGQRSETPLVDTIIIIGRHENNVLYISVLDFDKERPRIQFDFLPNDFSNWIGEDGQAYPADMASRFRARGWTQMLRHLIPVVMAATYEHVEFNKGGNNNGGNRGGQGGGGGGGYGNRQGGNGGGGGGNNYGNNRGGGQGGGGGSYGGNSRGGNDSGTQGGSSATTTTARASGTEGGVESGWDDDDLPD